MRLKSKKLKKLIAKTMMVIMLFTLLPNVFTLKAKALDGNEAKSEGYEIYPIPQSIEYGDSNINFQNKANVIFEDGIDDATKNRLFEVLNIKGISYEVGTEIKSDQTNFLVGINNSKGIVDHYFDTKNLGDDAHFEKIDSHIVSVDDNVIAVLGKDTDSAFYGLTSLKLIFKQIEGNEIRELLIKDYSDGHWRGFIEGYYGIPWSNENRMDLMKFGGDFKMNAYIFAPKDDEYHSLKWRDPYPAEKLEELRQLVEVGAKTKNKFIWTIHPFLKDGMKFDTDENYQSDLSKIIAKFEQLYSIGVRQFGVLADDAEGEAKDQVRLMNDLEQWRLSKGDVYSFIFVPKVYTKESAGGDVNNEYLRTISGMPESTEILWTGDTILGYVKQDSFYFFKEAVGREPFMWLNWPVNDINNSRLLMGKGEMLDKDVTNFRGIVTNPMQEAQASKVSLFAIADYGWNHASFDMDKSWEDSFKYIEPDATEELHTFAKHMSDPAPTWHGLTLEESEELRPIIQDFTKKLFRKESIVEDSKIVLAEYQEILDATNNFAQKSKNELMKNEIKAWVDSLRDLSESTIAYVNAALALEEGNYEEAVKYYSLGESEYTSSRSYRVQGINGQIRPEPGSRHLLPFAKDLSRIISEKMAQVVNPDSNKLTLFPYTNMGYNLYWGHVQNIVDGDNARLSTMWIRRAANEDDYVALELNEVTEVNSITFEQGEPGAGDKFNFVKFQSSMDGENWTDIDGVAYGPEKEKIVVENLKVKAKYVRVVPTGEIKSNWISVREFSINKEDESNLFRDVYTNIEALSNNKVNILPETAILENINDITLAENEYVGIKLNKIKELKNIVAEYSNKDNLTLETSINGIEWTAVEDLSSSVNARYIRIINKGKESVKTNITKLEIENTTNDVTFDVRPAAEAKFEPTNLIDGKLNTAFKPNVNAPKTGHLTYYISDNTEIKKFTVLQDPTTLSNAAVSIRTENGWNNIGELSKSVNVFNTSQFQNVFEIKIEWAGMAPTLNEIGVSTVEESVSVNREALIEAIEKAESMLNSDKYTEESIANLKEVLNAAKEVMINEDATQEDIDRAVEDLNKAISSLVEKPSVPGEEENPGEAGKPGEDNSDNDSNQGEGSKPLPPTDDENSSSGKGDGNLPNTGGTSPVMVLAIGGIILIAGVITLRKKATNN
ncbi:MAG: beta-N-acetylglucosaminidase domain-containing protein [Clostridium sp.]|nr:beta-N-acetylglucosaminidase domain-containing protein [Clostridium sp.]